MRLILLIGAFLAVYVPTFGQIDVWVFLTDKGPDVSCQLESPETFLSPQALQRRAELGIPVMETDIPVHANYINGLKANAVEVLSTSKWMNAVAVRIDESQAGRIMSLDYVKGVRTVGKLVRANASEELIGTSEEAVPLLYGQAELQNTMLNISSLHEKGMTGRGVKIAVLDAGFRGADTIAVFDSLHAEGRLLATYDFVNKNKNVYHSDSHGTQVLSVIAGNLPGQLVGTAPHASVMLFRTEDSSSETRQEEYNWVKAVEMADSLGADVIHSSLGYSEFDAEDESYTFEDMDGNSTIITRAADAAAKRGILVTVSAGNEGDNHWKHIVAPCDADSILCIGSVDRYQKLSRFSSLGPTPDGRIKPDVVAMGSRTMTAYPNNRIYGANGTSFSGPLVAGLVACLRQAHPERNNMDIIEAVRLSGDQAGLPDPEYGYGIPNAGKADSLLSNVEVLSTVKIVMDAKPLRGRQVTQKPPAPKKIIVGKEAEVIAFTAEPLTNVVVSSKAIMINTSEADANLHSYKIYKGKQTLTLNEKLVKEKGNTIKIKSKNLLEGQYYLHIVYDKFEEKIPFKL